ncbi:predicted protein [Histoplasma capsulatum H143]|uniref:Uncharacterized protein n=1 Tax=Ajellomyces capsulatus (strain H143) TaxID=544712 RepID=C6HCZ1_AJECH|nr:predicted protein [Histoplasma capsulatum H143]
MSGCGLLCVNTRSPLLGRRSGPSRKVKVESRRSATGPTQQQLEKAFFDFNLVEITAEFCGKCSSASDFAGNLVSTPTRSVYAGVDSLRPAGSIRLLISRHCLVSPKMTKAEFKSIAEIHPPKRAAHQRKSSNIHQSYESQYLNFPVAKNNVWLRRWTIGHS